MPIKILEAGKNEMGFVPSSSYRRDERDSEGGNPESCSPHRKAVERIATRLRGNKRSRGPTRAL